MEGPRGVRKADIESLRALTDLVMRKGLVDQYPQLFNEDNYDNLRICTDGGVCVSHVGMTEHDAALFGCRVRVGCIGGVCTHPDYRLRGLASACFDDALRKAQADGVDVMIVSGDRSLYRMRGCRHVGGDRTFSLSRDAVPPALEEAAARVTVETMEEELPHLTACYRNEPVRYIRPLEDYRHALQSRWVMDRASDFLIVREGGAFRAYLIVRKPEPDGSCGLAEFAGDRHAVLAALPHLLRRCGASSLGFHVMRHDALLRSLCEHAGLEGAPRTTPGTVTLLHFPQLMERMRPRFEEIMGAPAAARLRFRQEDDRFVFARDGEEFTVGREEASPVVFGTPEGLPQPIQDLPGALGDALRAILPLPTLWYGINHV